MTRATMLAKRAPRWRRAAVVALTEPPFVPHALWPRTIAMAALDRVPAVIDVVLDRVDITQLIMDRVSLPRMLESIDVDAVLARIDLRGIVASIVDDIDLPEIIRGSTGAMASESLVSVRVQSAAADAALDRLATRLQPFRRRAEARREAGQ